MPDTHEQVPQRHRLSVADFQKMGAAGIFEPEDRVELIDGEVFDMAPIGSRHMACTISLNRRLSRAAGDHALVSIQNPVDLDAQTQVQPDAALLRPRADCYAGGHPGPADILLVVEVSETTLRFDREDKLRKYAAAGIPEAWIVNLVDGELLVFRRPEGGAYRDIQEFTAPGELRIAALPDVLVDLTGLLALG